MNMGNICAGSAWAAGGSRVSWVSRIRARVCLCLGFVALPAASQPAAALRKYQLPCNLRLTPYALQPTSYSLQPGIGRGYLAEEQIEAVARGVWAENTPAHLCHLPVGEEEDLHLGCRGFESLSRLQLLVQLQLLLLSLLLVLSQLLTQLLLLLLLLEGLLTAKEARIFLFSPRHSGTAHRARHTVLLLLLQFLVHCYCSYSRWLTELEIELSVLLLLLLFPVHVYCSCSRWLTELEIEWPVHCVGERADNFGSARPQAVHKARVFVKDLWERGIVNESFTTSLPSHGVPPQPSEYIE